MVFYYILWFTFFILSLPYVYDSRQKSQYTFSAVLIAIVSVFVACRIEVGADWGNYVNIYETGQSLSGEIDRFEPLFLLSRKFFKTLGVTYQGYFFLLSFFSMFGIIKIAKEFQINNLFFVFLIYVSTIFCSYQLNTLRSGVMATCIWVALLSKSQGKTRESIIWCLVGSGFHYLGLAFLPVLFIINNPYKRNFILVTIALSYVALFVNLGEKIVSVFPILSEIERLSLYLDVSDTSSYGISIGSLFNLGVFLYCYFKYHDKYINDPYFRTVLNAIFWVIVFSGFFNSYVAIVSRFGQVLNVSLVFVWPMLLEKINDKRIRFALLVPLVAYLLMHYNKAFVPNAYLGYSTIVPFRFELSSFISL